MGFESRSNHQLALSLLVPSSTQRRFKDNWSASCHLGFLLCQLYLSYLVNIYFQAKCIQTNKIRKTNLETFVGEIIVRTAVCVWVDKKNSLAFSSYFMYSSQAQSKTVSYVFLSFQSFRRRGCSVIIIFSNLYSYYKNFCNVFVILQNL